MSDADLRTRRKATNAWRVRLAHARGTTTALRHLARRAHRRARRAARHRVPSWHFPAGGGLHWWWGSSERRIWPWGRS